MIRAALCFACFAVPATADSRANYLDALEAATPPFAYATLTDSISYGIDTLAADGTLTRYVGNDPTLVAPHLITVYDHRSDLCTWGFASEDYPAMDRTASLRIRDHAVAQNWPADAMEAEQGNIGQCIRRARLATTIGQLDDIDFLRLGPLTIFFGISPAEGTS